MTLNDYLKKKKIYYRDFATEAGVSLYAVRKWLNGERVPRDLNKIKIAKLTQNWVKPQDWVASLKKRGK